MAKRVVGYLEYGKALDHFDELVAHSSQADIQAIDSIIKSRPEFGIFGYLPDQFGEKPIEKDSRYGESDLGQANAQDERRGLGWVMALARVEFGAIIAGFTDHPEPYAFVTPESFDYRQSMQLLLEGVMGHYQMMNNDPGFMDWKKNNSSIFNRLAYSRRVRMARAMLWPLMKPGPESYSRHQAEELDRYRNDFDTAQVELNTSIRHFLSVRVTGSTQSTVMEGFANACTTMLKAEKHEIANGTATVRFVPEKSTTGPAR